MSFLNRENAHDAEDDVYGVKSIYIIIIISMYNERSDLFIKHTTPTPRPLVYDF